MKIGYITLITLLLKPTALNIQTHQPCTFLNMVQTAVEVKLYRSRGQSKKGKLKEGKQSIHPAPALQGLKKQLSGENEPVTRQESNESFASTVGYVELDELWSTGP
jgi:hypothetical protein